MASEHKSALEVVRHLVGAHPHGADLKICAILSAVVHYRRASVCNPFPTELFGSGEERDFEALRNSLLALPSLAAMAQGQSLSSQQLLLLQWLLAHKMCPVTSVSRASLEDVRRSLPNMAGWVAAFEHNPSLKPQCILQLQSASQIDLRGKVIAFHGTHMENVHSILHLGLLNLSGTRLERTGAIFGRGIYFSTDYSVAYAFCHPGPTWRLSALGSRQRCLFVCGIDKQEAKLDGDSQAPDRYLVVDRPDAVTIYYAFLFSDDEAGLVVAPAADGAQAGGPLPEIAAAAAPQAIPPRLRLQLPLLHLLYIAFVAVLLAVGLRENWPMVRRLARRHLGIRLP